MDNQGPVLPLKIVLANDGSYFSSAAVDLMTHMSWPHNTTVSLVSVVPSYRKPTLSHDNRFEGFDKEEQTDCAAAQSRAVKIAKRLREYGLTVQTDIQSGLPASIILHYVENLTPDLVVLSAKDLDTQLAKVGTTAVRVAHRANASVLIARHGGVVRPLKVLLAVDGSQSSHRAVEFLCRLSLPQWANITIVSVAESNSMPLDVQLAGAYTPSQTRTLRPPTPHLVNEAYAINVRQSLHHCGVQPRISLTEGDTVDEILALANYQHTDLIVVGAHSRPHPDPLHLGTVARRLIEDARCSVMVVR
ncbi:MAG: universal stress protein [Anaerolineae bacterium]|nr:universal stress protein [Anaerolineae bacterium]